MEVELEDAERRWHDWRQEGRSEPMFEAYREKVFGMMTWFEPTWEGYLGRIRFANHRIKLTLD